MGLAADISARFSPFRPSYIAVAALAVALAVQTVRLDGLTIAPRIGPLHVTLLDYAGWKGRAQRAEADLGRVTQAQAKAQADQAAANHQPAIASASIARQTDAQTPDYLRRVAVAAAGHAVPVGGLCGAKAPESGPGGPDLPRTDQPTGGDDGKAGSSPMVSVARADWEKLNREAALRVQLYQVGQEWIAQGIAKASGDDTPAP